mmetsp:Transcript_342/g.557  ORF Transcript_342/g.557 Transcript_342/m.557 type:complete len:265 (-) Transcript_342:196-990(-)
MGSSVTANEYRVSPTTQDTSKLSSLNRTLMQSWSTPWTPGIVRYTVTCWSPSLQLYLSMVTTVSVLFLSSNLTPAKAFSLPQASQRFPCGLLARVTTTRCEGRASDDLDSLKELRLGSMPGSSSRPKTSSHAFSWSKHLISTSFSVMLARTMSWLKSSWHVKSDTHLLIALVRSRRRVAAESDWSQSHSVMRNVLCGALFVLRAFPLAFPNVISPDRSIWPRSSRGFPQPYDGDAASSLSPSSSSSPDEDDERAKPATNASHLP